MRSHGRAGVGGELGDRRLPQGARPPDADVLALVLREKETNPFVGIDEIVKAVRAQDALLTRENVREIARDAGVKGRRGRPKKNSAE